VTHKLSEGTEKVLDRAAYQTKKWTLKSRRGAGRASSAVRSSAFWSISGRCCASWISGPAIYQIGAPSGPSRWHSPSLCQNRCTGRREIYL